MPSCRQAQPLNGLLFTLIFLRIIGEKLFISVRRYFSMTFFLPRTRDEKQHVRSTEWAVQVDTRTHTCTHTCTHVHAHTHAHTHVHTYAYMRACARTHTHVYTRAHTHAHAQSEPPPLTPHGANGVAESIAQDPLLLVVQDKHAVHGQLLGAGQDRPGVVVDALLEGDGLAPLVSVDVRRGSAISFGLRHRVLPGGGWCDHWIRAPSRETEERAWGCKRLRTWKSSAGLPSWLSGKESACQCRGHRFDPWSGKIPHAVEQLHPCAKTIELVL